jgi:hypothetical protein
LVTILKDLFENPEWKVLVATTLILLIISIISSLIVMLAFGDSTYGNGKFSVPYLEQVAFVCIITSAV